MLLPLALAAIRINFPFVNLRWEVDARIDAGAPTHNVVGVFARCGADTPIMKCIESEPLIWVVSLPEKRFAIVQHAVHGLIHSVQYICFPTHHS